MTNQLVSTPSVSADGVRRRWHFAKAILDERNHQLLIDGVEAEVERKPLDVLFYLIQHAGEVCTKDELLAAVWPGRILSETALAKCISRLREVLGDDEQGLIRTAHGYGYRFVAAVRVEYGTAPEPPRLAITAGDHPHARPHWTLVRRIGAGGHGEAWLASHDKTREQRVFKFALDEASLAALKREITLFRVINDTLGEDAKVVRLLDWNLEQAPYFIEAEYLEHGSLLDWVRARGGSAAIPLGQRLELVARIADALASVHAVGVLHKDLKPSNILIVGSPEGDGFDVRLADFGSGGLLDFQRFEDLGITRLGFTKTAAASTTTSGTLLYLAPEIVAGQPFTVKSDIYALGIILFQILAGEFNQPLTPGWERVIADELLREDIAQAADGNPAARLENAAELARRLRSLDQRHQQRAAERAAQTRAQATERALERARARRTGLSVALATLLAGLVASTTLYIEARRARDEARAQTARAEGVAKFISDDMLARLTSGSAPVKDLTVIELLNSAVVEVDQSFADQPDTAAAVHAALGRSYLALDTDDQALRQLEGALDYYERREGAAGENTLKLASEVLPLTFAMATLRSDMDRYVNILKTGEAAYGDADPKILPLRMEVGRAWVLLGNWTRGMNELKSVAESDSTSVDPYLRARSEQLVGHVLDELGEFPQAERYLRRALVDLSATRGPRHLDVSDAHMWLARVLSEEGRFEAAETEFVLSEGISRDWVKAMSGHSLTLRLYRAEMLIEQDKASQAIPQLESLLSTLESATLPVAIDETWGFREPLALAYLRVGRLDDAAQAIERALRSAEAAIGADHPATRRIRILAAEIARERGLLTEARTTLQPGGQMIDLSDLPGDHPMRADFLRVIALLDQAGGNSAGVRDKLTEALRIYTHSYGAANWRTLRLHQDLD